MNEKARGSAQLSKIFLLFGIAARAVFFIVNLFVGGYNSDEVMTSLNAACLADKMTDVAGEKLPVYFDTWVIGGQSPFATYLSALSVKLFGYNDFGVRVFALVFSILSLLALYGFAKEVFGESRYSLALVGLGAVSPWAIFSGTIVLDCNYLGHVLMIALYFFSRAVNTQKTKFYVISSVFFALGFYCYIASVLFIPVLLFTLYLILIIRKKISFKNVAISVAAVFAVSVPFILFGLVSLGAVKPFELFGFSFSSMPSYERTSQMIFSASDGGSAIADLFVNVFFSLLFNVISDSAFFALGVNVFSFGALLCGLLFLIGAIHMLLTIIHKGGEFDFKQKLFALSFFAAYLFFSATVSNSGLSTMYRSYVFSYVILYFSAIGLVRVISLMKKAEFKKALSAYLAICFAAFCFMYGGIYARQISPSEKGREDSFLYGDSYYACLDFANDNGYDSVVTYKTESTKYQPGVFLRSYYYDGINSFCSIEEEFKDELKEKNSDGSVKLNKSGSISYKYIEKGDTPTQQFLIVESRKMNELNIDKDEYKTKDFGFWSAVYKENK